MHGVIGLGGLQGTAVCTEVMRALPYGLPKVMVSTVASGNTSAYVDVMDITMMFSVADIIGLNAFLRRVLANAAGAAHGMAQVEVPLPAERRGKPLIGMSNLGVLTSGALLALELFAARGYEVIVFHAVGSGGRAMELMMRQGIIGAVFDYAMGEITDELFGGVRAGGPERLTVAGELGLPQVLCPGGAEHVGVLVDPPNSVPDRYKDHKHVFHNPVIFVPRLQSAEMVEVARDIGRRLQHHPEQGGADAAPRRNRQLREAGRAAPRPGERRRLLRGAEGPRAPDPGGGRAQHPRRGSRLRARGGRPADRPHRTAVTPPDAASRRRGRRDPKRARRAARPHVRRGPAGAPMDLVVIVHGVTSQRDRPWARDLAAALAAAGIAVVQFSFSGNGASEGRFEDATPDEGSRRTWGASWTRSRAGGWPASATAWAAPSALLRAAIDPRIAVLVSLAGMLHVHAVHAAAFRAPRARRGDAGQARLSLEPQPRGGRPADRLPDRGWRADIRIPWLLVHGTADELVPLQDSIDAQAAALGRPELVTIEGADHRFTGAHPALLEAVVPWTGRQLAAGEA